MSIIKYNGIQEFLNKATKILYAVCAERLTGNWLYRYLVIPEFRVTVLVSYNKILSSVNSIIALQLSDVLIVRPEKNR